MADPFISEPIAGAGAFEQATERAAWSQAGLLLAAGVQLTGDAALLDELPPGSPRLAPLRRPFRVEDARVVLGALDVAYEVRGSTVVAAASAARSRAMLWAAAQSSTQASQTAAAAVYLGLSSAHEPVRVVSAAEWTRFGEGATREVEQILVAGCRSSSPTLRTLAAHAIERNRPDHPVLRELSDEATTQRPDKLAKQTTSILVHGTFSRLGSGWWRPGSEFFDYVKADVTPDLYDKADAFRWTGRYRQADRTAAAQDLAAWLHTGGLNLDTALAHSHGGNVVLDALATNRIEMRLLVLLSVPALSWKRKRSEEEWIRIKRNVSRIFALRSHCDLVVLSDRSAQEYPAQHVKTVPLRGVWFHHAAACAPETWRRLHLADDVRYEHRMAAPRTYAAGAR